MADSNGICGSTCVIKQHLSYCYETGRNRHIESSRAALCHFAIDTIRSSRVAKFDFPLNSLLVSFEVHIVNKDVPVLLSIDYMDSLSIYLNNLENRLVHPGSGSSWRIVPLCSHPYVR